MSGLVIRERHQRSGQSSTTDLGDASLGWYLYSAPSNPDAFSLRQVKDGHLSPSNYFSIPQLFHSAFGSLIRRRPELPSFQKPSIGDASPSHRLPTRKTPAMPRPHRAQAQKLNDDSPSAPHEPSPAVERMEGGHCRIRCGHVAGRHWVLVVRYEPSVPQMAG